MTIQGRPQVPAPPAGEGPVAAQRSRVPAAPAPARVAAAPRRWRMRGLLAATLVVLLGGLVLLWAVPAYTGREQVLVLVRDVRAGQTLVAEDFTRGDLTVGPPISVVKVDEADSVLGQLALTDLPKGSVLARGQVGVSRQVEAGQLLVPLPLKVGQLPARGFSAGQSVLLVPAPQDPSAPSALSDAAPVQAVVVESGDLDPSTGVTVVDVRVRREDGVGLAKLAATGSVTVVVLPDGQTP